MFGRTIYSRIIFKQKTIRMIFFNDSAVNDSAQSFLFRCVLSRLIKLFLKGY